MRMPVKQVRGGARAGFWRAAALVLACAVAAPAAHAQVKELRMIESGGKSGDSMEAYIKPFTAKSGIAVVRESPANLGKLRAMVQSGAVNAVLFELGSQTMYQAIALNLLEPLDWAAIAPEPMYPEARHDMGFGWQYFSTVMAWRKEAKAPKSWADFFNVKDFPGKRSLPDRPTYALTFALLSDGVPADKLYPLDLDRAFKVLDRVKGSVSVWWAAGAQPAQLLADNEVQYAIAWPGRVIGLPNVDFSYEQGQLDLSYLVMPKGVPAPEKAATMKLLHEFSVPKNQLAATEIISYTGASPQLTDMLPKDKLHEFPTANKDKQFLANPQWWLENAEKVEKRWQEFKLGL